MNFCFHRPCLTQQLHDCMFVFLIVNHYAHNWHERLRHECMTVTQDEQMRWCSVAMHGCNSVNYRKSLLLCFSSSICTGTSSKPTNSLPPDTLLNETDLLSILRALKHFVDWEELGLELGLLQTTLDEILQEQKGKIRACKRAMLTAWLQWKDNVQQKGLPSWKRLLKALRQINPALAAKIKRSAPWQRWYWQYNCFLCCFAIIFLLIFLLSFLFDNSFITVVLYWRNSHW